MSTRMEQTDHRILLLLILIVSGTSISGCSGFLFRHIGRYYQTELDTNEIHNGLSTIGIYVFSDGQSFSRNRQNGLEAWDWPIPVTIGASITPDTSNTGPSLELAISIRHELSNRRYRCFIIEDLGHSQRVSVDSCIANARARGLDAAMVVFYSGLFAWNEPNGCDECKTIRSLEKTRKYWWGREHNGYLYLPNAAIISTSSNSTIWSTRYYGIVQNAHVPNFANVDFSRVPDLAVIPSGDTQYMFAAPKTAHLMFDPMFWPGSFKEFPSRPAPKRKL